MKQNKISQDFHLSIVEHFADSNPVHRHNCFEIIYILEGRGVHVINENQFAYGKDDFFLLTPADSHAFLAHELSCFCIIDFTGTFFGRNAPTNKEKTELSYFFKQLEYVFHNANQLRGYIPP